MTGKGRRHCCFGVCNSTECNGRPGYDPSTRFYRFPQPCLLLRENVLTWDDAEEKRHVKTCGKCKIVREWMVRSKRDDYRFKKVRQISPNFYVCSKHFIDPPAKMDYARFVPCDTLKATAGRRSHEKYERLMKKRYAQLNRDETPEIEDSLEISVGNEISHGEEEMEIKVESLTEDPMKTIAHSLTEDPPYTAFQEVKCLSTPKQDTKLVVNKEAQGPPAKIMVDSATQTSLSLTTSNKSNQDVKVLLDRVTELKLLTKRLENEIALLKKEDKTAPIAHFEKKVWDDEKMCQET